jgi:hypothetical protein
VDLKTIIQAAELANGRYPKWIYKMNHTADQGIVIYAGRRILI